MQVKEELGQGSPDSQEEETALETLLMMDLINLCSFTDEY